MQVATLRTPTKALHPYRKRGTVQNDESFLLPLAGRRRSKQRYVRRDRTCLRGEGTTQLKKETGQSSRKGNFRDPVLASTSSADKKSGGGQASFCRKKGSGKVVALLPRRLALSITAWVKVQRV